MSILRWLKKEKTFSYG